MMLPQLPPTPQLLTAVGGTLALSMLVALAWRARRARRAAGASARRPSTPRKDVLALAAAGAAPHDIARQTGLSYDAVVTLLRAQSATAASRHSRPRAARFSFPSARR